jgi:hypothetical protein
MIAKRYLQFEYLCSRTVMAGAGEALVCVQELTPEPADKMMSMAVASESPGMAVRTVTGVSQLRLADTAAQLPPIDLPLDSEEPQSIGLKDDLPEIDSQGDGQPDLPDIPVSVDLNGVTTMSQLIQRLDIDGDGEVQPRDALLIIDFLNNRPQNSETDPTTPQQAVTQKTAFKKLAALKPPTLKTEAQKPNITPDDVSNPYDVNRDGRIAPRDVLFVVAFLNGHL